MEFPDLGEYCSESSCKRLDFLPVKCDACRKVFCQNHYIYDKHKCPEAYRKDNQVPICPLCNTQVPLRAGEVPDIVVGHHIDNDCQSEKAQTRRKVYTNRCSHKGCKQKEMVPLLCEKCRLNYCLKHRHEMDHSCKGFQDNVSKAGAAAISRLANQNKPTKVPQKSLLSDFGHDLNRERQQRQSQLQPTRVTALAVNALQQPGLSEEEALSQALALSLQDSQPAPTVNSTTSPQRLQQEMEDEELARALQESEREARTRNVNGQTSSRNNSCLLS